MSGCVRVRVLMFSVSVFTLITVHADGRGVGGCVCLFVILLRSFFLSSLICFFFRHFLLMLGVRV